MSRTSRESHFGNLRKQVARLKLVFRRTERKQLNTQADKMIIKELKQSDLE